MNFSKLKPLLSFVILTLLLYLITDTYWEFDKFGDTINNSNGIVLIEMNFYGFLLGIFLNFDRLYKIILGKVKLNLFPLLAALVFAVLIFIPPLFWINQFGPAIYGIIPSFMESPVTRELLSVLAGYYLVIGISSVD